MERRTDYGTAGGGGRGIKIVSGLTKGPPRRTLCKRFFRECFKIFSPWWCYHSGALSEAATTSPPPPWGCSRPPPRRRPPPPTPCWPSITWRSEGRRTAGRRTGSSRPRTGTTPAKTFLKRI